MLRLVVTDTGKGFGDSLGTGVGLTNIRERLAALYGEKGKLTLVAAEPHGVVATIEGAARRNAYGLRAGRRLRVATSR